MELIDLYVKEVGRHLPEKMRADIEQELRSTIEDTLEDESHQQGRPVDEEMVIRVLRRMGSPHRVAMSYLPARYLIGPELFPTYLMILRIVVTVLVAVGAVYIGISLGLSVGQPVSVVDAIANSIGQALSWFLNAVVWAAGIITLIFALIQWTSPHVSIPSLEWDPRKLKPEPDTERVNRAGMVAEIVLSIVALILFNLYPQWIGIASMVNGHWVVVPILTPAILALIPWFSLLIVLNILQRVDLIIRGRWASASHWEQVALDVFTIVLSIRILLGPAIVAFPPDMVSRLGWGTATPDAMQSVSQTVNTVLKVFIALGIFGKGIEVIKRIYRVLIKRQFSEAVRMG